MKRKWLGLVCSNPSCPAKAVKNVLKWLEVHECKGIAEKTVQTIHENIPFSTIVQFNEIALSGDYEHELVGIKGFGKTVIKKLAENWKKTHECTIVNFLGGLNFEGFGRRRFKKIVTHLLSEQNEVTIEDVLGFIENKDITVVDGFSERSDVQLKEHIAKAKYVITAMLGNGVVCEVEKAPTASSAPLTGSSFCFTGALNHMKRKEAQEVVEALGGEFRGSVGAGLSYLVTNTPDSGSAKNKKAEKLGVKIITEEEFLTIVNMFDSIKNIGA
jgi:DNA ligase (NAD+)